MFSTKTCSGKAFAAEQKIREFKKIFKSKRLHKSTKTSRLNLKKLIKNPVENMNKTNSQKYDLAPDTIEKKSLENENFWEVYDFRRMVKVSKNAERYKGDDIKFDKKYRKKLRSPWIVGEKVLVLAERLKKKKTCQVIYIKAQPKTFHFLIEIRYL